MHPIPLFILLLVSLNFCLPLSYGKPKDGISSAGERGAVDLISGLVESCCVIASLQGTSASLRQIHAEARGTFLEDRSVCFTSLSVIPDNKGFASLLTEPNLVYFARRKRDLSCLHSLPKVTPKAEAIAGVFSAEHLVDFVNSRCGTYRTPGGALNSAGREREELLANLYDVPEAEDTDSGMEQCERVSMLSREDFFKNYMSASKPVIVKNALQNWTALTKWSNGFFYNQFGQRNVHVKLSPDGEFEGCEPDSGWSGHEKRRMPAHVRERIDFPDLVVVRPATTDVPFSAFMDHITSRQREKKMHSKIAHSGNASAYLEYTSIPNHMPELEQDISPMPFLPKGVRREHLNLWLSDGNTLGKLHFDPYDNILAQVDGVKEVTLFSPHHNDQLYEGYIPQAALDFSPETGEFGRNRLLESTALVMSPVDIKKPDYNRFPLFRKARPMKCRLTAGDVLFMPAFWWHEVQSRPGRESKRNLAVNFWYTPFLTKDFPCSTCPLDVNPAMRHLMQEDFSP